MVKRTYNIKAIHRILDANFNRATEGLRVCEEISRFILNERALSLRLKIIRHYIHKRLKSIVAKSNDLIKARNTLKDVGRDLDFGELNRKNYKDVFFANIQRVKESVRVLEEFSKLINKNTALGFKKIRYEIYGIEKSLAAKIQALRYSR